MTGVIVSACSILSVVFSVFVLIIEIQRSLISKKRRTQKLPKSENAKRRKPIAAKGKLIIRLVISIINCLSLSFIAIQLINLAKFEIAVNKMNSGDFVSAQEIFRDLDETALYMQSRYFYAKQLYDSGNYKDAALIFAELEDYGNSKQYLSIIESANLPNTDLNKIQEDTYATAHSFYNKGQYAQALTYFRELSDYKDSEQLATKCLQMMRTRLAHTISAGIRSSVGIRNDGTIVSTGNRTSFDYHDWTNIVSISNKGAITIGLKEDGTVISTGDYSVDVSTWSDIIAVSAGEQYVIGLKSDGTVLGTGHDAGDNQLSVSSWTDIIAVATGWRHTVGLCIDGTVFITGYGSSKQLKEVDANHAEWENIIAIAAGGGNVAGKGHTVGLRADGKVVAVGDNTYGQCNVEDWTNIVAIAAGDWHTVGLCADGTVVSTHPDLDRYPNLYSAACDVDDWTDIVQIAAGSGYTLGLRNDGSVVAVGYNDEGKSEEVKSWRSIKVID